MLHKCQTNGINYTAVISHISMCNAWYCLIFNVVMATKVCAKQFLSFCFLIWYCVLDYAGFCEVWTHIKFSRIIVSSYHNILEIPLWSMFMFVGSNVQNMPFQEVRLNEQSVKDHKEAMWSGHKMFINCCPQKNGSVQSLYYVSSWIFWNMKIRNLLCSAVKLICVLSEVITK